MKRNASVLQVTPNHWLTWNCRVVAQRQSVATLRFSNWGEAGELNIQNYLYQLYREDRLSKNYYLADQLKCIAIAQKPNPLFRQFFVKEGDRRYELKATSAIGRQFILQEYGQIIGSLYPAHCLSRKVIVDLPESIPLSVKLFMVWLMLLLWKRQ
ncbi:MAG: hypothetical protein MUF49_31705 [Oculatellaceae cyanobacterium Prado106]|nr:hypothetical protein [Oculatellaceae cyanobacterium Prado106]